MVSDDRPAARSHAVDVLECLAGPPEDLPGVLERLERLQELVEAGPGGAEDGLACFNHLYREITREVLAQLAGQELFREPEFVARLAVELARRYLGVVRADAAGEPVPRSWSVLFDRRRNPGIGPIEFAVAGVNAHVNYDLAQAVVQTCTVLGCQLGPTELADHRSVNGIVARYMSGLQDHFETWLGRALDGAVIDKIMDGAGTLGVVLARDAAWRRAEHLWSLRTRPAAYERECASIDWRAAMIGRGVLLVGGTP